MAAGRALCRTGCGQQGVHRTWRNYFASSATSASGANAWSVGLNWYLNKNIRADLSFSHTIFDGFTGKKSPGVVPAQSENVLFSRVQLAF